MKVFIAGIFIIASVFTITNAKGQLKKYTTANAHSHNDYLNANHFFLAYENGFGSIEADIFPIGEILYVAHKKEEIQLKKTLQDLYIVPLIRKFSSDGARKLNLLIDIKENYSLSLSLLIKELEPLKPYLSTLNKTNYITIIISGDRPPPTAYKDYPDFIFFDNDLQLPHSSEELKRVALVSFPFDKISKWKGEGAINAEDRKKIKRVIDTAHAMKKSFRFWAAPDSEQSWKLQMELHADFIGTDKINELGNFLRKQKNR
ncbi:MAG TPA: alkaline phosphatase [Chitinophagaceae bacterium]|nr:alkaline phosphatase [Chitinophagaceae bacterium]